VIALLKVKYSPCSCFCWLELKYLTLKRVWQWLVIAWLAGIVQVAVMRDG
jgi:hypothetical protein